MKIIKSIIKNTKKLTAFSAMAVVLFLVFGSNLALAATKIDDAGDPGAMPGAGRQVVRTSAGTLYSFINDGGSCEIWKSTDGTSWAEVDSADNPTCQSGDQVAIAIDSADTIHMIYLKSDGPTYSTYYITLISDNFSSEESVFDGVPGSTARGLAIDSNNIPHVVYYEGDASTVYYDNRIGGAWNSSDITVEAVSAISVDITINEDNIPEISYINFTDADLTAAVGNANDAISFTLFDVDTTVNVTDGSIGTSIAVDSSGNTWIGYADVNPDTYIHLVKHNDADAWTTWQSPVTNSVTGREPSIAINGTDIYIFYKDANNDVAYDRYNGSWKGSTVLQTGTFQDVKVKWSYYNNNQESIQIDYLYSDGTDIYWDKLINPNVKIRQEINIIDGYLGASSGSFATSSEIINIDTTKHTSPLYYFEVVASTSASITSNVYLRTTSGQNIATLSIPTNTTSETRLRSSSFTPTVGSQNYVVVIGNESGATKSIKAARVIALEDTGSLTKTQTQIEIGNRETGKNNTATAVLNSPKYWYYDYTYWDSDPDYYAEVSYKHTQVSGSTVGVAIEEDDGSFGSWTFKKMIVVAGSASTATRVRSTSFVPTNGRNYRLVASTTNASASYDIYNAKIVVDQYSTGTAWDVSTGANSNKTMSVSAQDTPTGIVLSADGTKAYMVGPGQDRVYQYTLTTPWDISTGSYASKSMSVAGQETNTYALALSADGTKAYIVGWTNSTVYQYTLTTAWDISTGSYASKSMSAAAQDSSMLGLFLSSDGTKAYVSGNTADRVYQYTLSTPWDISTGSYASKSLLHSGQDTNPIGFTMSSDGTKSYMVGNNYIIYQYTLSTAWDISTGSYASKSMSVTGQPQNFSFSADGSKTYVAGVTNLNILQYKISSAEPTKFETQYLLGNTLLSAGTALQKFLTYWDLGEWSSQNSYYHEANSVSGGTSGIKLQDSSGSPDITGSSITSIIQRKISSILSMPSAASTIDVIATTNNNDIYASRILVRVDTSQAITVPAAVSNLNASTNDSGITLSWSEPNNGGSPITGYKIYRDTSSPAETLIDTIGNTTTYLDTTAIIGTNYYYRIKATNSIGDSLHSNQATNILKSKQSFSKFIGTRMKLIGGKFIIK